MDKQKAEELLDKYLQGAATAKEKALVEYWVVRQAGKSKSETNELPYAQRHAAMWEIVSKSIGTRKVKLWLRIAPIAAAVIGVAIGIYFYTSPYPDNRRDFLNYAKNDIAPGGNRATLTANGNTINLSETKTGLAIDATAISYNDGTKIDPSKLGMTKDEEMTKGEEMTVNTPRGGTYSIILQDGTKVWLNSDSKLEFLSNYRNAKLRTVKLTGEAYFEVAKDKKRPFIVQSPGQFVKVLGTHFNVNCYPDEPVMRTTLLEGKVMLEGKLLLKPGEQGQITRNNWVTSKRVDVNEAVAWKAGKFRFTNTSLEEVMRQLARWYDVDVVYPDGIPAYTFTGGIDRGIKASEALKILQIMKVKFKIEGRKIIVLK